MRMWGSWWAMVWSPHTRSYRYAKVVYEDKASPRAGRHGKVLRRLARSLSHLGAPTWFVTLTVARRKFPLLKTNAHLQSAVKTLLAHAEIDRLWWRARFGWFAPEPHTDGVPHIHGLWWTYPEASSRAQDWPEVKEWWWDRLGKACFEPWRGKATRESVASAAQYALKYARKHRRANRRDGWWVWGSTADTKGG